MIELVDTPSTVHDLIRGRWSSYAFTRHTVEWQKLLVLLKASRWATSYESVAAIAMAILATFKPFLTSHSSKNLPLEFVKKLVELLESL